MKWGRRSEMTSLSSSHPPTFNATDGPWTMDAGAWWEEIVSGVVHVRASETGTSGTVRREEAQWRIQWIVGLLRDPLETCGNQSRLDVDLSKHFMECRLSLAVSWTGISGFESQTAMFELLDTNHYPASQNPLSYFLCIRVKVWRVLNATNYHLWYNHHYHRL